MSPRTESTSAEVEKRASWESCISTLLRASTIIALTVQSQGKLKEAEMLLRQALEIKVEIRGENHPSALLMSSKIWPATCAARPSTRRPRNFIDRRWRKGRSPGEGPS